MASELEIVDVLRALGFDEGLKTKLVRHQDSRFEMSDLVREGWFELYQAIQGRPILMGASR